MKVLVATPMYGGMCTGVYTQSITQLPILAKESGVDVSFAFIYNNSLIPHARNQLADIFLTHDFTHLFFIDADIEFKPADFMSMLAADKDVIAGIYPKKQITWELVRDAALNGVPAEQLKEYTGQLIVNFLGEHKDRVVPLLEPFEVKAAATGFMCIKREVFERLEGLNKFREGDKTLTEYFFIRNDPESQVQMSEDIAFCWVCREQGIKIHVAPWVKLKHMGNYVFEGMPIMVSSTEYAEGLKFKAAK